MKNIIEVIKIDTAGKGMYEITNEVIKWTKIKKLTKGQLNLFIQHTSASLTIMENTSPDVLDDINNFFLKLVPEDSSLYKHSYEGDDDMPAHIKYMLTQTSLTIPIIDKKLILGTWQGLYLFEHRLEEHTRTLSHHLIGD